MIHGCLDCKTRYYYNYKVTRASDINSKRQYYTTDIPEYIEVTDHMYVDKRFCEYVRLELSVSGYAFSILKADGLTYLS